MTRALQALFMILPVSFSIKISSWLTGTGWFLIAGERNKTLNNLRLVFGSEKDEHELRKIGKEVFRNGGRNMAEFLSWEKLGHEYLRKHVKIHNGETLRRIFKEGNGIIGLTAHFGNWELLAACTAKLLNIDFSVIAREMSNPYLNGMVEEIRTSMGMKVIYREKALMALLRTIRDGKGLGILGDQNIRGEGIYIPFLGHPAKTPRGLAELIYRTRVPVVPMFIIRNKDLTSHDLIIENPLIFDLTGDKEEDLKLIAASYTSAIEKYVRQFPEQWMWMHDRWGLAKK